MRKLDKTETLVTIGDMTYIREVTKLNCIVVCVYISSLTQFAYFLSLFELVSLLSKQANQCFQGIDFAATCVCRTRIQHYCLYSDSPTCLPLMMPRPPAPSAL